MRDFVFKNIIFRQGTNCLFCFVLFFKNAPMQKRALVNDDFIRHKKIFHFRYILVPKFIN